MSLKELTAALDAIDEGSWCAGTCRLDRRLAIALPDGDLGVADDPQFARWLGEHAEPAPFGEKTKTKVDAKVRRAERLVARDKVRVVGFDPESVLDEIAAVMSPGFELAAKLVDVVVYPEGGKFAPHKDTPRSPDLVGTLVVEVPSTHQGGALRIDDGRTKETFDWSGKADHDRARWVALYSDVDHEVTPVTSGSRVTLVYALTQSDRPRENAARREKLRMTLGALASQPAWPVMIACSRLAIGAETEAAPPVNALRGMDRELAAVLAGLGYDVGVRACAVASEAGQGKPPRFPDPAELWTIQRLHRPLGPQVIGSLDAIVTFSDDAGDDEGGDFSEFSLAEHILDEVRMDQWVVRESARATFLHEALCSDRGYFGNEAYQGWLYTLAALEVTPAE
jgi:predicted 2-oxoglutarate/Fe(II)-dependent dioxygenase YbiX